MLNCVKLLLVSHLFLLSFSSLSHASQQDTPLVATVEVRSIFKISIQSTMLNFGTVDPGISSSKKIVPISCTTNNNNAWSVSVNVQSPLAYEQYEIPLSNFKWEISTLNGTGQVVPSGEMSLSPNNFYTAALDENITETPIELALSLYVDVPRGQVAGTYRTIVIITMHEE